MPSNFCLLRLLTWREPWKRQEKRKGRSTSFRKVVGVDFKVNSCLYAVTKRKKSSAFVLDELGPRRVRIVVQ